MASINQETDANELTFHGHRYGTIIMRNIPQSQYYMPREYGVFHGPHLTFAQIHGIRDNLPIIADTLSIDFTLPNDPPAPVQVILIARTAVNHDGSPIRTPPTRYTQREASNQGADSNEINDENLPGFPTVHRFGTINVQNYLPPQFSHPLQIPLIVTLHRMLGVRDNDVSLIDTMNLFFAHPNEPPAPIDVPPIPPALEIANHNEAQLEDLNETEEAGVVQPEPGLADLDDGPSTSSSSATTSSNQ